MYVIVLLVADVLSVLSTQVRKDTRSLLGDDARCEMRHALSSMYCTWYVLLHRVVVLRSTGTTTQGTSTIFFKYISC